MMLMDAAAPETGSATEVLAYEAPFLVEKLLKDHIVATLSEGESIFLEVKRWMLLVHANPERMWEMYSIRVDEVWHQFILFTREYMKFCTRYFGGYVPHSPSNAPESERNKPVPASTFEEFRQKYQQMYSIELPDAWYDERSVTLNRRVLTAGGRNIEVTHNGGLVDLRNSRGAVLFEANVFALDALLFVVDTGAFYVRELPGGLTDEEKVALAAALVECGVLRVAS